MTVQEFVDHFGCRIFCLPDGGREIKGGYVGDLLSWVMGKLEADHAWVTIMSNINIVAVASLADPACIILSEGVEPDVDVIARAKQQGINMLGISQTSFDACAKLISML